MRYTDTCRAACARCRLQTACHAFADPYVEHDTLTLLLDLILLKRDVYRHLLYNRGLGARKVGEKVAARSSGQRQPQPYSYDSNVSSTEKYPGSTYTYLRLKARRWLIAKLGFALICVDACELHSFASNYSNIELSYSCTSSP